jgi:hypothetical protein
VSDDNSAVIAPGNTYFLHVTPDGTELRFSEEPENLYWKTHLVRIVEVDGDFVVEETTLPGKGLPMPPHGAGWESVGNRTWRRQRPT